MKENKVDASNYYNDSDNLITNLFSKISYSSSYFKIFFPDQNYLYPMNEYLYKYLQPIIDDILFIGDNYNEQYTNTELLISIFIAIQQYKNNANNIWGPSGRYIYILNYGNKNISNLPINDIIEKIGLYDEVKDKDDFINKYKSFLSKIYY